VHVVLAQLKRRSDIQYDHLCLIQDITERKAFENALYESERSKSVLLANLPGMAYRCDFNRQWTMRFVSEGCHELTGYPSEDLLENHKLSFDDLIAPECREDLWAKWKQVLAQHLPFKSEYEIITAMGNRKWVLEMGQGVYAPDSDEVLALEGIIIDITDRKMQEIKLKHISEVDSLTDLHNRMYLENILSDDAKKDWNRPRAIVLLSLRKLNNICLAYGYSFCEQIIKELAQSLVVLANENRGLFQISFERFAFYITQYQSAKELEDFCRSVIRIVDGIQMLRTVGGGIGVLEFKGDQYREEDIIRNASMAAEHVNENDVFGYRFFDQPMETAVMRETEIKKVLVGLVNGAPEQQLYLQYQPILNLKTNRVVGCEALARLKSKTLGAVSPLEFIPIAEETQLIIPIGKSVLEMACAFQKRLQKQGHGALRVFVNVSAIQLVQDDFMDDFLTILQKHKVSPQNIGMEITESVLINNFAAINEKLEAFRGLGVRISIDDFGTGYSSLNRERDMNVDYMKIDKSFIDGLMYLRAEAAMTGDIISMAHKLGHIVVAEGVEHEKQRQYLLQHDCDLVQGYYFCRPLDEERALEILLKGEIMPKEET
ncbi:MAG: EAL domain-containing protein, partial [Eubacteriales bacterium]|nr:EAL domain-containing protein [Eubacteriales bacterium]